MFNGFSHSVKGASHEKTGLVCQDSSAYKVCDDYAVCVVADGHGSKKHFRSNMGSKFAVEATISTIDRFYADKAGFEESFPKDHKRIIKSIQKQIIADWNTLVEEHLKNNPVTKEEKSKFTDEEFEAIPPESYYGTTLIVGVAGKNFTFGVQIGDGTLVALFDDGKAVMPMEYNEAAPANVTASMCNSNAASMFSAFYRDGQKLIATPCIDRMAAEGMLFTDAYAGCPVSAPSRCSFMTGQHTGHAKIRGNREYWGRSVLRQNMFAGNADYYVIGQEPYDMTQPIIPELFKDQLAYLRRPRNCSQCVGVVIFHIVSYLGDLLSGDGSLFYCRDYAVYQLCLVKELNASVPLFDHEQRHLNSLIGGKSFAAS